MKINKLPPILLVDTTPEGLKVWSPPNRAGGYGTVDGTAVRELMFEIDCVIVPDGKAEFFNRAIILLPGR